MEGEYVIDSVCSRFGCRTFKVDPERGFILNGEEYPLRGVTRHGLVTKNSFIFAARDISTATRM